MKNYVKNEKGYEKVTFETKKIKLAYKKLKSSRKHPTSINLSEETVAELKKLASAKGVPYQTLMRMLVLEGIEKLNRTGPFAEAQVRSKPLRSPATTAE